MPGKQFSRAEIDAARARYNAEHPSTPSSSGSTSLGGTLEQRRRAAARKAGQAYARALKRRDLDPAKRQRDLAALDPQTRQRVENYTRRTHL